MDEIPPNSVPMAWKECIICYKNKKLYKLKCSHSFCYACVMKMEVCAICRKLIHPKKIEMTILSSSPTANFYRYSDDSDWNTERIWSRDYVRDPDRYLSYRSTYESGSSESDSEYVSEEDSEDGLSVTTVSILRPSVNTYSYTTHHSFDESYCEREEDLASICTDESSVE